MKYLKVLMVALLATFTFAQASNAQDRAGMRVGEHHYYHHHRRVMMVHHRYYRPHRVVVEQHRY